MGHAFSLFFSIGGAYSSVRVIEDRVDRGTVVISMGIRVMAVKSFRISSG